MTFNRALFSSASGDWETPQELFDELDEEFRFTLDGCATEETAKHLNYFGPKEDGLKHSWATCTVFVNPPYGRGIGAWLKKGYEESQREDYPALVVMLLPARTDTAWWHGYVMKADEIRFIRGRLKFSGHKNSAPFPSCIVVFRSGMTRFGDSGPAGPEGGQR